MKKSQLFILFFFLIIFSITGQTPQKFSYQAVVRNKCNQLVANLSVGMQISILQGSSSGTIVYTERQMPTTNFNGMVSIEIGDGKGFNLIDWTNGPFFIKTETDITGGTNYTITGTSQLLTVPYAIHANTADSIVGISPDSIFNSQFSIQEPLNNQVLTFNSLTGKWENRDANFSNPEHTHNNATQNNNGFMSNTDKVKLDGIALEAEKNVNADWNATSGDALIFNKPNIADSIKNLAVLLSGDQTINGDKTFLGTLKMNNKNITNVAEPVDSNDAATKAYVDALIQRIEFLEFKKVMDIDSNIYNTVKIGDQIWMKENLKTTRYLNGDPILLIDGLIDLTTDSMPKYQWTYNNQIVNHSKYGRLYTWYTVTDHRKICPKGWHVPSDEEWTTLTNYLTEHNYGNGNQIAKSMATTFGWESSTTLGTIGFVQAVNNRSGFSALPAGLRINNKIFTNQFSGEGMVTLWWSTTESTTTGYAWLRQLSNGSAVVFDGRRPLINGVVYAVQGSPKYDGLSVRCLKD